MGETVIFENAFLIDGTGADPREGATVVVADGIIQKVSLVLKEGRVMKDLLS